MMSRESFLGGMKHNIKDLGSIMKHPKRQAQISLARKQRSDVRGQRFSGPTSLMTLMNLKEKVTHKHGPMKIFFRKCFMKVSIR